MARVRQALASADLDAIVCALPANVLLLTGYWPVVGTALAVAGRDRTILIAPADEAELARGGFADDVLTFEPGSLARLDTAADAVRAPLAEAVGSTGATRGRLGFESGAGFQPASYVSMHLYGAGIVTLLTEAVPRAALTMADGLLTRLRSVKTPTEIDRIRAACRVAESTFRAGAATELRPVKTEVEAAARFAVPLASPTAPRSGGRVSFMSGINSATAYGSYARSTSKPLARGDLVLVHCNSHVDGYWTDITRTFCLGPPDDRRRRMYAAVADARAAALAAIKPGVAARDVDRAARDVLRAHGFGEQFKHPTGHGVGFAAIDHSARPRLHAASDDVLEIGSVFNVEPGVYRDGLDGMRHCDMVAVTETRAELLTPFQAELGDLVRD
jgi:Xaa-Pro aminopeptidase